METAAQEEKYKTALSERERHTSAILSSTSKNKIVVAGPGTGKTHLFKEVLKGKTNTLTLTFVNALVEDLSLELCGISDVRTLHSYARSELSKAVKKDVKLYPKLPQIIQQDAKILLGEDINFDQIFHDRDDENKHIDFYKKRKDYYDYYGYSDVIFAIVKHFESKKDKVPTYEQVVVDEFQDFNKLEVSLIDLLSEKSPMLLAGDDDQALYGFKRASADHIRHKHSDACPEYAPFNLPFCSRCTRVIVDAANDVINEATKAGLLKNRINKPYTYLDHRDKDKECARNPKIMYNQSYAGQIPWFIQKRIGEIAEEVKGKFSVLIISPTKTQSRTVVNALREKGFENIEIDRKKDEKEPVLMDALELLLEEKKSNLGWRIAAKCLLSEDDFKDLLSKTQKADSKGISEMIDKTTKKEVEGMLKILKTIKDDKKVDEKELNAFLVKVGFDPYEISSDFLKSEMNSGTLRGGSPGLRRIPIKATTIQSSKGLAADYVFITHFDDTYFIKDKDKTKITDQDVCNFLVAITRAKKKLFLISSNTTKQPTFAKWIKDRIEKI